MAGSSGYLYVVRLAPTAFTASRTLIQIVAGAAAIDLVGATISQITKSTAELLRIQILRKTVAATVTSATPILLNAGDSVSLAVGGTTLTGVNASAEGTDGDVLADGVWNVLNGEYNILDIPEMRRRVPQAGIVGLKLITAPAASMTIGGMLYFIEYR